MMNTDAYTIGSGLYLRDLTPNLTSVPLAHSQNIRIGWIKSKSHRLFPEADEFITCLQRAAEESFQFKNAPRQNA